MVVICRTKVNCHSMSSQSLTACINSVQNNTPLFTWDRLPGEPIILFFLNRVLKVQRDSEWTTIVNAHWWSRYLITSTDHSYYLDFYCEIITERVSVLKGQFTQNIILLSFTKGLFIPTQILCMKR